MMTMEKKECNLTGQTTSYRPWTIQVGIWRLDTQMSAWNLFHDALRSSCVLTFCRSIDSLAVDRHAWIPRQVQSSDQYNDSSAVYWGEKQVSNLIDEEMVFNTGKGAYRHGR